MASLKVIGLTAVNVGVKLPQEGKISKIPPHAHLYLLPLFQILG